jgi:hypothetical protein
MPAPSPVRDPQFASPDLPGNRPISTSAAVEALDLMIETYQVPLPPAEADMLLTYACQRYQRGEIEGARKTLSHYLDLTAVYRIESVLHTPRPDEVTATAVA